MASERGSWPPDDEQAALVSAPPAGGALPPLPPGRLLVPLALLAACAVAVSGSRWVVRGAAREGGAGLVAEALVSAEAKPTPSKPAPAKPPPQSAAVGTEGRGRGPLKPAAIVSATYGKADADEAVSDADPRRPHQPASSASEAGPHECHTAVRGEECYGAVLWAYFTGIHTNPEWYEGLSLESEFEDFQAKMHQEGIKNCTRPCDTSTQLLAQQPWGSPSLFCFSVAIGDELNLMRAMVSKRAGIFDCDEKTVLSDSVVDLGMGIEATAVEVVDGGVGQSGTAANVQTFINAWNAILSAAHHLIHDFTVKVDPDAVLLPSRLRDHVQLSVGRSVYVPNCDHTDIWPGSPDYPMMYGAVEVISRGGMQAYEEGRSRCEEELGWAHWGEDLYLGKCLSMLGVEQALDVDQVRDETCCPGTPEQCPDRKDCTDTQATAFHKFKAVDAWLDCWQKACGQTTVWMQ